MTAEQDPAMTKRNTVPKSARGAPAKRLSPRQAEALLCRCAEGMSFAETCDRLGIEHTALAKRLERARDRLGARTITTACFAFGVRGRELAEAARRGRGT